MNFENAKDARGFTLVELLLVVAIMGIIAAIAIPQYQQYVIKGNRAAAQSFMMEVSSRQKQYLLDARAFAPDLGALGLGTPPTEVSRNYNVTLNVVVSPPAFTVTATPIAGRIQEVDGVLTLDDLGAKTPPDKW